MYIRAERTLYLLFKKFVAATSSKSLRSCTFPIRFYARETNKGEGKMDAYPRCRGLYIPRATTRKI